MKKVVFFVMLAFGVGLFSCASDSKPSLHFTCGTPLKQEQLKEFEVVTKPAYSPLDLKLVGKISLAIFDATNRKKSYNVQFFENTRERLVVQVYGIWELVDMDQAACAVFNFKDYMLPTNTQVIFYQNEKSDPKQHIVAGVKMGS